jgi:glycosyltransferase involved in cell wall biosynthesis
MFNFIAPFTDQTSYGIVANNILSELNSIESCPSIFPIGQASYDPEQPDQLSALQNGFSRAAFYNRYESSVRLFHEFSQAEHVGSKHIAFPIFELDTLKPQAIHHLKNVDQIIVCSEWAREVMMMNVGCDCEVVPLGVNTEIFKPAPLSNNPRSTIFMNVGKWEKRKGHDILHTAFRKAFSKNDDVVLWMMPDNPFIDQREWDDLYQKSIGNQLSVFGRISTNQLVSIMQRADCFVFPTRAEGWGLPILEAMSLGKEVIVTYYSGQTQFINNKNARLIEIDNLELANDGKWFHGEGSWAEFGKRQEEQLIEHMRAVHRKKQMGENLFNEIGRETALRFTWRNTTKALLEAIK